MHAGFRDNRRDRIYSIFPITKTFTHVITPIFRNFIVDKLNESNYNRNMELFIILIEA